MNNINTQNQQTVDPDEIDLWHYYELIKQYFWALSLFVAICTGISIAAAIRLPPVYQTNTSVLISTNKINTVDIKELVEQNNSNISTHLDTQLQIINSNSVMFAVIKQLDLANNPDFITFEPDTAKNIIETLTLKRLRDSTSINLAKNTKVINISASNGNPDLAKAIADAIAATYISQATSESAEFTSETFNWLQKRSDDLKGALNESELATLKYKETNNLFDVSGGKQKVANEIKLHSNTLRSLETTAYTVKQDLMVLKDAQKLALDQALTRLSDRPEFASLQNKLLRLELKKSEKSKRYGPAHKTMIALNRNLSLVKKQVRKQLQAQIQNHKNKLFLTQNLTEMHRLDLDKSRKAYRELEIKTFALKDLERQESRNREMYNIFSSRARETLEASTFSMSRAKIIDVATTPVQPIKPNKKMIVILAMMLSGMAGFGFIIILDIFRQRKIELQH